MASSSGNPGAGFDQSAGGGADGGAGGVSDLASLLAQVSAQVDGIASKERELASKAQELSLRDQAVAQREEQARQLIDQANASAQKLEEAKRHFARIEAELVEQRARISHANEQLVHEVATAKQQAHEQGLEALAQARAQAQEILDQARAESERARSEFAQQVEIQKREVGDVIAGLASRQTMLQASLDGVQGEITRAEQDLAQKRAEAGRVEQELAEHARVLANLKLELEARRSAIEAKEVEVAERGKWFEQEVADRIEANVRVISESHRAAVEATERDYAKQLTDLRGVIDTLNDKVALAELTGAQAGAHASMQVGAKEEVEAIKAELAKSQGKCARLAQTIESMQQEAVKGEQRYEALARKLHELQTTIAERASTDQAGKDRQLVHELDQLRVEYEGVVQVRESLQGQIAMLREQLLRATSGSSDAKLETVLRENEILKGQFEVAESQRQIQQAKADALAAEVAEIRSQLDGAQAKVREAQEVQAQVVKTSEDAEMISVLTSQVSTLQAHLDAINAERSLAQVQERSGTGTDASNGQVQALEAALAQREETLRVLANRLLGAEERQVARESEINRLQTELAVAAARRADEALTTSMPNVGSDDFAVTRRARLRTARMLLKTEHRKILAAKEALGKYKSQCDAIMSQRAQVAEMANTVQTERLAVEKSKARSGAALIVGASIAALVVLGSFSFMVARTMLPATYAARVTLAADGGGRELSGAALKSWTEAHRGLLADPQVMAVAAERFSQRGFSDLSSPGAVSSQFAGKTSAITDQPGKFIIEYLGSGRSSTAREIEVFAGAIGQVANDRRASRVDGASTRVVSEPDVNPEAVSSNAPMAATIATIIGFIAAMFAGVASFRMLAGSLNGQGGSSAKKKSEAVDIAMPTPYLMKLGGDGASGGSGGQSGGSSRQTAA